MKAGVRAKGRRISGTGRKREPLKCLGGHEWPTPAQASAQTQGSSGPSP